jgi:hypothetical protein
MWNVIALFLLATPSVEAKLVDTRVLTVEHACHTNEAWSNPNADGAKIPSWLKNYQEFVKGKRSPLLSFSEALPYKDLESDFSEYWVARTLYELKLDALSHQAFASVYNNAESIELKKAAVICMAEIEKRSPDQKMPNEISWEKFNLTAGDEEAVLVYALGATPLLSKQNWENLPAEYRDTIQGLIYSRQKQFAKAVDSFSRVHFSHYPDQLHLLYGRALYAVQKYPEAILQFQLVSKTSNLEVDALNGLAWGYLLSHQYEGAIGVAMQLRSGILRNTFSPEPIMVAAMAFNELCQFQDSIRMVNAFIHDYSSSYEWLHQNQNRNDLYTEVLHTLKKTSADQSGAYAPAKVSSDWIKGATFLTRQNEINRLIKEPDHLKDIQNAGIHEQTVITEKTLKTMKEFIRDVKVAQLKLKPGQELSDAFAVRYLPIKKDLRHLKNFYRASRTWTAFSKNYEKRIPQIRTELVNHINVDLKKHQQQMLSLIEKVRDNSDLIEVEIYNGASKDMIWKNAHPDYDENQPVAQDDTEKKEEKEKTNSAKFWNWGRFLASDIENIEVWEDEMGSLKADLSDQCKKKEKYLSLKMKKRDAP